MARSEVIDNLTRKFNRNCAVKGSCADFCDRHDVTVRDPSPGHCPMGPGRSLNLRWMEKVAGGGIEVDD